MNELIEVRRGTPADAETCQRMVREFRDVFGFISLPSLRDNAERGGLNIAHIGDTPVGFVSFRPCRDGWQSVYELCVSAKWHRQGVGQALLASVPTPIRLKCPTDLTRSNRFYVEAGMTWVRVETEYQGRSLSRPLNVYHLTERRPPNPPQTEV